MTKFRAVLRNGHGQRAYIDTKASCQEEEIVRREENAEIFASYSDAMNAVINTDTRGWAISEIEVV